MSGARKRSPQQRSQGQRSERGRSTAGRPPSRSAPAAPGPYGGRSLAGPRQSWGWHPLTAGWADRIVGGSGVGVGDLVVDLGAGTGALTRALLSRGARVWAVELHPTRAATLRDRFADRDVRVIEVDLERLRLPPGPFAVVASPPYNLGVAAVRLLLQHPRLSGADLVLPRHLVARLVAAPPRARHAGRYLLSRGPVVPPSAFTPPPRVTSQVLRIRCG